MTWIELYDSALIEQNKVEAPTLLIEEFNYLINKAIQQYINLSYARYEINQQSSDDLRWLQRTAQLKVFDEKANRPGEERRWYCCLPGHFDITLNNSHSENFEPYLHVLGCTVEFKDNAAKSYCNHGYSDEFSLCRRLTSDQLPSIIQNAYLKPTYKNPYFFLQPNENKVDIICGKNGGVVPDILYMDYLKTPEKIELTWDDVQGEPKEGSHMNDPCEFPNAVAYEIINIFVRLVLENSSDPRLQTNFAVNQTVGEIPTSGNKK